MTCAKESYVFIRIVGTVKIVDLEIQNLELLLLLSLILDNVQKTEGLLYIY